MKRFLPVFIVLSFWSRDVRSDCLVRIWFSRSLSGKYTDMGAMQSKGFRLCEGDVNSRGGLIGKKVALVVRDNRSDPAGASGINAALIGRYKVDGLFAPDSSERPGVIRRLAEEDGYPLLTPAAAGDLLCEEGYKHSFGVYTTANRYTTRFLEMLATKKPAKRSGLGLSAVCASVRQNGGFLSVESVVARVRRCGSTCSDTGRRLGIRFISGYAHGVISTMSMPATGVAFVQKPFAASDLLGKMRGSFGKEEEDCGSMEGSPLIVVLVRHFGQCFS